MLETCGVQVVDMSIEDITITNTELAKAMSQVRERHRGKEKETQRGKEERTTHTEPSHSGLQYETMVTTESTTFP